VEVSKIVMEESKPSGDQRHSTSGKNLFKGSRLPAQDKLVVP
jgi:hypothetical protein